MVSLSTSLKTLSPFSSSRILFQGQQSKHNPNSTLLFASYNKPNPKFLLPKRLVVSHQKSTFMVENVPKDATKKDEEISNRFVEGVRPKREFWERSWNYWDVRRAIGIVGVHVLSLFAPFHFNWPALQVAVGLSFVAGMGLTVRMHLAFLQ